MNIRLLEKSDIKACSVLFANTFSADPWNEDWTDDLACERLSHFYQSKGFVGVLAEENGAVVGFSLGSIEPFYKGSIFYLREMCTAVSQQNKGIGSKLFASLEALLATKNVKGIYLATDKTIPAASFYQNNGFTCTGNMSFYSKGIKSQ